MKALYDNHLLLHYKQPSNAIPLTEFTVKTVLTNHLCGDHVEVRILLLNNYIEAVSIQASGCVISVGAGSIFSQYVHKKSLIELQAVDSALVDTLIGIKLGPVRIKCALLSFDAILQALESENRK